MDQKDRSNHLSDVHQDSFGVRIISLESVQRRASLTKEPQHLPYEERLKILSLTDLKTRRERGDFIQINKIVHGIDKVN